MTITTPTTAATGAWIRRFHPAPAAEARLVCLPHAGGSASYYYPLSRALTGDVEVLAVQYPGRQDRRHEAPVDDVATLADRIVAELGAWSDLPIALFGHSLGATVGFEVAARLEAAGTPALGLFASGRRAPRCWRDENVHLSDDAGLVASLRRMDATASAVLADPELVRSLLPAVRADYRAAETYLHDGSGPLVEPVVVMVGDIDPEVTVDEAQAWRAHTTGPFDLLFFPGGHFYLNEQGPAVQSLVARYLRTWITAREQTVGRVNPTR